MSEARIQKTQNDNSDFLLAQVFWLTQSSYAFYQQTAEQINFQPLRSLFQQMARERCRMLMQFSVLTDRINTEECMDDSTLILLHWYENNHMFDRENVSHEVFTELVVHEEQMLGLYRKAIKQVKEIHRMCRLADSMAAIQIVYDKLKFILKSLPLHTEK